MKMKGNYEVVLIGYSYGIKTNKYYLVQLDTIKWLDVYCSAEDYIKKENLLCMAEEGELWEIQINHHLDDKCHVMVDNAMFDINGIYTKEEGDKLL